MQEAKIKSKIYELAILCRDRKVMSSNKKLYAWRILLGKIINDPQERQRVALLIGANHVTLIRWSTNKSTPRIESLRRLLQALPRYRQQLLELIPEEFPEFFTERTLENKIAPDIPSAFYERVLQAYTATPPHMRPSSVRITIIQQLLVQNQATCSGMKRGVS